ncbi:GGDEF domain-containing protein [Aureimonas altamirensis]|uniref:GGDEF domain-containing protein n=1 Tax=Aureimonas altamirensis TaxID=370622 RepID=UPI0020369002|nr:GGDEF domain-containing protein [Aureimonas altamirensis]MCM2504442.1 GGDEF domain-containing protein [Aureimonas altamirensis]
MHLDQTTLLTAAGLSSAALAVAFLSSWIFFRNEKHLLIWATGLVAIIIAIVLYNSGEGYPTILRLPAMALLIAGFVAIDCGSSLFCAQRMRWGLPVGIGLIGIVAVTFFFVQGLSGIATASANLAIAALMSLTGWRFWVHRHEALLGMGAVAVLYGATALSFAACAAVLFIEGPAVLTLRPSNWAEELNAVASIVGLTSIGAISFALMQFRTSQQHRRASLTDPLTQLPNRRALTDNFLEGAVAPGTCLILFDLDHFKQINDRYGHAAGDVMLVHFAGILAERVPDGAIAARLGGEEFGVMMPQAAASQAHALGEAVRRALAETPVANEGETIAATVTAGFAIASDAQETGVTLFSRADRALYEAKRAGRNRVLGAQPELVRSSGGLSETA